MKKSMTMWAVAVAMTMTATAASAQTRSGFALGLEHLNYGYSERFEGETVAKDEGAFSGATAAYTKVFSNRVFFRGELAIDSGSVDYRSDVDGTRLDNIDQTLGSLELHLGRDFMLKNGTTVSPFIGLASRVLNDYSGGRFADNGMEGYDRTVAYRYIPVGAAATFELHRATTLTVSGQYNHMLSGHVDSKFSRIDSALPDVHVSLNRGSGYEVSAMINLPMSKRMLSVGPFVSNWNIKQSKGLTIEDPEGSGDMFVFLEPASRATKAGIRVTFSF